MSDPTPRLLLASFAICAVVVAVGAGARFQTAKKFWHAREVLTAALVDPSRTQSKVELDCRDCDWETLRAGLPMVDEIECYDDIDNSGERGVRCRAFFDGSRCLDADVFGVEGAWRVTTSGRIFQPCLP